MNRLACLLLVALCLGAATVLGDGDKWFPQSRGGIDIPIPDEDVRHPLHPSQAGASPLFEVLKCPEPQPAPQYTCKTRKNQVVLKFLGIPIFTSSAIDQDCTSTSACDEVYMGTASGGPLHSHQSATI